jgi:uncharacterized protein
MRWQRGGGRWIERRSGGGGFGMPVAVGGGGLGLVGLLIYLAIAVLGGGGAGGFQLPNLPAAPAAGPQAEPTAGSSDLEQFLNFVMEDNHQTWQAIFDRAGRAEDYRPPKSLVVFEQAVQSGCGFASAQTGPFYCPLDERIFLDLGFFQELASRFGAPGDFAQAYVVSHEFAHHMQNVLGIMDDVREAQQEDRGNANEYSIRLELQADCFAGVWAHSAYGENLLESGDLEEGLRAAAAVGDDRIQQQATGRVDRESWTHGSSEQRMRWFRRGFDGGDPSACDTFEADGL